MFRIRLRHWLLATVVISVSLVACFALEIWNFYHAPVVKHHNAVILTIKPGQSIRQIARYLNHHGVIPRPPTFVFMSRIKGLSRSVQAGEYQFAKGSTANDVLDIIADGRVYLRDYTLVEGWNFKQTLDMLHSNAYLKHDLIGLTPFQIMAKISSKNKSPEGHFFPETYLFARYTAESDILKNAYELMQEQLMLEWAGRAENLPYKSPDDALIVASLIEKETAIDDERPQIAGVIIRRLAKKMYLQIDPSVIYGLGKHYNGKLTKADLALKTPYNLYKQKGLPPTPIAMPSLASIRAALHPASGNSLYFMAKGDGSHVFNATLEAHNKAVKQYRHD